MSINKINATVCHRGRAPGGIARPSPLRFRGNHSGLGKHGQARGAL